jgi:hypothetical protein
MNDIFIHNQSSSSKTKQEDKFYGIIQNYDFIDKDNNPRINSEQDLRVLAKIKVKNNGQEKFLIKLDNNKKLYNPSSPLPENKKNRLLEQYGADSVPFKEVSKKVFEYYMTFLRTSNPSWIHNAEREDF